MVMSDEDDSRTVRFNDGEDVVHSEQDEAWKDAIADGRGHVSHREMTSFHRGEFMGAIRDYKLALTLYKMLVTSTLSPDLVRVVISFLLPAQLPLVHARGKALRIAALEPTSSVTKLIAPRNEPPVVNSSPFRVCVRCRPLLKFELDMDAYSCIDDEATESQAITLHDGKLARDGRRLTMTHHQFFLDEVYSSSTTNQTFCDKEIAPLVAWAETGHASTLLCFGQTGTGKTYTLVAALEYAISRLLGRWGLEVTFFELADKKCKDLLNGGRMLPLRSDATETVHARGARVVIVHADPPATAGAANASASASAAGAATPATPISTATVGESTTVGSGGGGMGEGADKGGVRERDHGCAEAATSPGASDTDDHCSGSENDGNTTNRNSDDSSSTHSSNSRGNSSNSSNGSSSNGSSRRPGLTVLEPPLVVDKTELLRLLQAALSQRSSQATERNSNSSRSHAICTIKLRPPGGGGESGSGGGKLTLVDLAGSERNYETMEMSGRMHRESAAINASLMALKDCFRAYHAQMTGSTSIQRFRSRSLRTRVDEAPTRAPYRASMLTRVLRECFVPPDTAAAPTAAAAAAAATAATSAAASATPPADSPADSPPPPPPPPVAHARARDRAQSPRHMTTILATVSPTPTDVEHSINSLHHVVLMSPALSRRAENVTVQVPMAGVAGLHVPVEDWTPAQVNSWVATVQGGRFASLALPPGTDGRGLQQLSLVSLSELFEGELRRARQDGEGVSWVVQADDSTWQMKMGKELIAALRRRQHDTAQFVAKGGLGCIL